MRVSSSGRTGILLFCLLLLPLQSVCQNSENTRYSFDFNGISLSSALEDLASKTQADLIYDPNIVEGYTIYKRLQNKTVNEILEILLHDSDLDYIILSSGTFVVVETSKRPPYFGTLSGKIVDAETGEPLPGATIMLTDASGGTTSNSSGNFNLGRLIEGDYQITFSYVGYEPVQISINISPEQKANERIPLQPGNVDFTPIVVSAHKPLYAISGNSDESIEPLSGWGSGTRTPEAIQSLTLFSGIQYGLPMTDLHLQGSQRGGHRIFLDGIPVYNPYSFGHLFSAFSPYSLGRVRVDKAGFDVTAGSQIAGKIDLTHDISNRSGENALLQIDPVNSNVRANIGNTGNENDRFQLMAALRSTFWNWYQDPVLSGTIREWDLVDPLTYNIFSSSEGDHSQFSSVKNDSEINYLDLHFASRYEIDAYQTVSYSLYKGDNSVKTDLLARDFAETGDAYMFSRDNYQWGNLATQISYDWLATPRLDLRFQLSFSRNQLFHSYAMFDSEMIENISTGQSESTLFQTLASRIDQGSSQEDDNLIRHFFAKNDFNFSFSPSFSLGGGFQFDRVYSLFNLTDYFYLPTLTSQESSFYSSYLNGHWMLPGNFQFIAGSRFTILSPSGKFYPEPRASLQYDNPESSIGYWSLKIAGGIYRQFVNQFDLTNVGPSSLVPDFTIWAHDSSIRQPIAYHTSLSFLLEPSQTTSVKLESYMKVQPSTYITSYSNLLTGQEINRGDFTSFAEITDMFAYGGGARVLQTFMQSRLQLLFGYDLSISKINMESQFGRVLPAPWNEPHRFQARIRGQIHPAFSIIANWQSIAGRSWGFRQAYYDFMVPHNFTSAGEYDFLNPENDRLSPFHQLDLSFVYQPVIGSGNIEIRLNLINLLNRRNSIDWNLYPISESSDGQQQYEIRERTLPGINPSASLKISF